MIKYREILRLRASGVSFRNIAYSCDCSKSTVQNAIKRAHSKGLVWPLPEEVDDTEIYRILFSKETPESSKANPDYALINKELARKGVTLTLCWNEYCESAITNGEIPYQYSAFCNHYKTWAKANHVVMHIDRRPGEQIMVDWCGTTMEVMDRDSGKVNKVYIFVACLPYSSYLYAQGFYRMDQEAWLTAHVHAFEFFKGATPILVPDNLKTGIVKNGYDELIVNESYRRLSEHYGCVVVPARVRKPRDKGAVESGVGVITRQAIAAVRNRVFFELADLNAVLLEKTREINARHFQKRAGSRESVFFEAEQDTLIPLPKSRFAIYVVKTATVPYNYHISVESIFYSVPYSYVKQEVEIRISRASISIYSGTERIAMHKRSYSYKGSYVTNPHHMPESHKDFTEWTGDRFRKWACEKGEGVADVIDAILRAKPIEQQAYRSCRAVIALSDKHGDKLLNEACIRALAISRVPSYKTVKTILARLPVINEKEDIPDHSFAYLRGADYFDIESHQGE